MKYFHIYHNKFWMDIYVACHFHKFNNVLELTVMIFYPDLYYMIYINPLFLHRMCIYGKD